MTRNHQSVLSVDVLKSLNELKLFEIYIFRFFKNHVTYYITTVPYAITLTNTPQIWCLVLPGRCYNPRLRHTHHANNAIYTNNTTYTRYKHVRS